LLSSWKRYAMWAEPATVWPRRAQHLPVTAARALRLSACPITQHLDTSLSCFINTPHPGFKCPPPPQPPGFHDGRAKTRRGVDTAHTCNDVTRIPGTKQAINNSETRDE
jgi:hypothetical protein